MTQTETKPSVDAPTQWPPVAHIAEKKPGTVQKGDVALCGARLMGINLEDASELCEECVKVLRSRP